MRWRLTACLVLVAVVSCSYDYDAFELGSTPSSTSSGPGAGGPGASGGTGAVGGASVGSAGGSGGASGEGGVAGAGAAGGDAGAGGCGAGTKACGDACVSIDDPAFGCASSACGPCAVPNATAVCAAGGCAVGACAAGFEDCNGSGDDGCEADLEESPDNCGACARACATAGVASLACAGGLCVSTCELGFANCVLPAAPVGDDGCETDASDDSFDCGGCGNVCAFQGNQAGGQPFLCDGGGRPKSHCGCWTNKSCRVGGSGGHCNAATGRCSCSGQTCREGEACIISGSSDACACNGGAACAVGQACCQTPAGCVDLNADPQSCGACGRACAAGFGCALGACVCTTDAECDAGSPGTIACVGGHCTCFGVPCAEGERCQADGGCG